MKGVSSTTNVSDNLMKVSLNARTPNIRFLGNLGKFCNVAFV